MTASVSSPLPTETSSSTLFVNAESETKGIQYLTSGFLGSLGTPLDIIQLKLNELQ
jgi:hypothetical protein